MMSFREWLKLNEAGTSTANVAGFKRISLPMRRRDWARLLGPWSEEDLFFSKKKNDKNHS